MPENNTVEVEVVKKSKALSLLVFAGIGVLAVGAGTVYGCKKVANKIAIKKAELEAADSTEEVSEEE